MQLQKFPLGLTGALQLKVTGAAPPAFGDVVLPTIDAMDYYLAQGELDIDFDTTAPGLASSVLRSFTVPNGKAWRLLGAGMSLVLNAADVALTGTILVGLQSPNSGVNSSVLAAQNVAATGTVRAFGTRFDRPVFLPSGWKVVVQTFLSANITIVGAATASVFRQQFDQ